MSRVRVVVAVVVLCALVAACGQKNGVAGSQTVVVQGGDAGAVVDDGTGEVATDTTVAAGDGAAQPTAGASGGAAPAGGATATTARPVAGAPAGSTSGGAAAGGTASGGAATAAAGPNDKVGISDKELKIGIHAPVTGAAPFPQSTFEEGRE